MSFPANVIPVFGSQRAYADLNFAGGSFGLDGRIVNDVTTLPGWSFTRASLATMFDSTGKLTYGPNNLCLQSQTFGTTWSATAASVSSDAAVAPDGTTTADKLVESATNAQHYLSQALSGLPPTRVLSIYAKYAGRQYLALYASGGGACNAWYDLQNGTTSNVTAGTTATITDVGNGWYRCSLTKPNWVATSDTWEVHTASVAGSFTYTGDGTSGIYLWGAQLEAVTYQTTPSTYYPTTTAAYYGARLVYDPVTLASLGILVEEARTNVILQSNTFNTTWTPTNLTLTAGATTGPDGTASGWKFENTATAATNMLQSAVLAGTVATGSVYIKAGTSATNDFVIRNVTTATNLISATVTWATPSISGSGWTLTAVGNGWYRVVGIASTGITSGDTIRLYVGHQGSSATAGQYFYAFGAQLEAGTGASSPIPTTTASVTRAADVPYLAGLSGLTSLTVCAEGIPNLPVGYGTNQAFAAIDDGSTANRVAVARAATNSKASFITSVTWSQLGSTALAAGAAAKAAYSSTTGAQNGSINGELVTAGTDTQPTGLVSLSIGVRSDRSSQQWNGTISRIRVWQKVLPNTQLQALTT